MTCLQNDGKFRSFVFGVKESLYKTQPIGRRQPTFYLFKHMDEFTKPILCCVLCVCVRAPHANTNGEMEYSIIFILSAGFFFLVAFIYCSSFCAGFSGEKSWLYLFLFIASIKTQLFISPMNNSTFSCVDLSIKILIFLSFFSFARTHTHLVRNFDRLWIRCVLCECVYLLEWQWRSNWEKQQIIDTAHTLTRVVREKESESERGAKNTHHRRIEKDNSEFYIDCKLVRRRHVERM